jgi:hypothetical protein
MAVPPPTSLVTCSSPPRPHLLGQGVVHGEDVHLLAAHGLPVDLGVPNQKNIRVAMRLMEQALGNAFRGIVSGRIPDRV